MSTGIQPIGAHARVGALILLAVISVASCGDRPTSPSALNGSTNLRLLLTDDPIDDVDEVRIYFTSVTVKPTDGPVERELAIELDAGTENPVDLLALQDDVIGFAAGLVEPRAYEFIHINIDERRSYLVENGQKKSLQVPNEKIKIVGGFSVSADAATTLTLDFDAKASLLKRGNGEWLLTPIVVITGNNTSSMP
jgi:hypothetical protein